MELKRLDISMYSYTHVSCVWAVLRILEPLYTALLEEMPFIGVQKQELLKWIIDEQLERRRGLRTVDHPYANPDCAMAYQKFLGLDEYPIEEALFPAIDDLRLPPHYSRGRIKTKIIAGDLYIHYF